MVINAVVSRFCVEMYNWVKDNEEEISIVLSTKDALIAPKIQSLISELLQEYFEEARFHVPEPELLDMSSYKKTILRSPQTLTLLPAIDRILNPIKAIKQVDRPHGGGGGTRGDDKKGGQIKFDEHKEQELCGGKKFFHQVIQKNGLHLTGIPKPMFNDNLEECGKYCYTLKCNDACRRRAAHVPPSGERKKALIKFKDECFQRYAADGGKDFQ